MFNLEDIKTIAEIILAIITVTIAIMTTIWANYKFREYREFKHWIQFEIDANIYKLNTRTKEMEPFILDKKGKRKNTLKQKHTHAVEVVLKFTNKSKRRLRIYNIQTKISTMGLPEKVELNQEEGHLRLDTIFNSGNVVPKKTKFYYIEPQVEQVITFLTLITEPRELIRVNGKFSLEKNRIFPEKDVLPKYSFLTRQILKLLPEFKKCASSENLLPHTVERTYKLDSEGYVKT